MNTDAIFHKIKELGHVNSKREELREYCGKKIDQILDSLPRRILNSDGGDVLDCLFNGLPDISSTSSRHKIKVVNAVLDIMRKECTSLTHCGDITSRVCLELPRLPLQELVRWCDDSVQSIVTDADVNMIWRDILPECLSAISSYDTVKHCGTDMTATDYKQQCVHTLCQCRWTERQLVQLAAMFKDLQLPRNDHRQVVNKICSYIMDMSPDTLPPLVHQLLKLCKQYNVEVVLANLSHYFSVRLYSKLEPPPQDSESTTMDLDDIVQHSPAELSRCLSTCLYHISQGAAEPELIRKHLKQWPKSQLLRNPFLIDLALAMSDKGADFRSACLDVIKSAIEQRVLDEIRSKQSAWVRSVLPPDVDVASVLKVLTTESANHRQLTVVGLINLAFSLLSINKVKPTSSMCWSHGKLILVRLSKSQPETVDHILTQLADKLVADATCRQYAECLHVLCKLTPVSIERSTRLSFIIENCQPVNNDYVCSAQVLDAVHPLISFSARLRDSLVLCCRKGLCSRDSNYRCLALSGLLTVLKHMKVSSNTFTSSQSVCSEQYSGHSYLTQLTVDLHNNTTGTSRVRNEAMCMEVVSILRRCLTQDAAVKQLLCSKLYDCVKEKPVLHESILELLNEHLTKFLPDEGDNGSPLLLDKCVQLTGATAVLSEPISRLLYCISQFLQQTEVEDLEDILSSQTADTGSAYLKTKLNDVLERLCSSDNFGQIDLQDPGLTDLAPESKAKSLKVQQILQCYETFIAYRVMQWNLNSTDVATSVYNLFKAANQLLDQTKAPPKAGKKGGKSTLNDTRETVKSQKSQKSQKDKGKGPVKLSNLVKDRAGPFKPLPCLWDLRFCLRIVELLYSEYVPWSSQEQRNNLRGRRDFHHHVLRNILSILTPELDKRAVAMYVPKIAAVLYKRCVCRFQDMCEFDDQTALSCLEVFKACLTLLFATSYSFKVDGFLENITNTQDTTAASNIASILERIHANLLQVESEGDEQCDIFMKKFTSALVQIASLLLETTYGGSPEVNAVIIKLEEYVRTSKQECLSLIPSLLTANCGGQQEAAFLDELLVKLTAALGRIDEEDTSAATESPHFPSITERSGHCVLSYVCAHMSARGRLAEHLLARGKDLRHAGECAPATQLQRLEREQNELTKSLIVELCSLVSTSAACGKLRCNIGAGSDKVFTLFVTLYTLINTLLNNVNLARHAHTFERLLKLSGKKLSTVCDNLITYCEASQQQQSATKVLRDTKLIPRLVLASENFTRNVLVHANKAKVNYQQYLSLGTARDFRIRAPVLQEVLNANQRDRDQEDNINDAVTEVLSPAANNQEDVSDEENTRRKKRRVS